MNVNAKLGLFTFSLGALSLVAGLRGAYVPFVVALLGLLGLGLTYLWQRRVFHKLDVTRTLSQHTVHWGQTVEYRLEVTNRKFLPVFGLEIKDEIPTGVNFTEDGLVSKVRGLPRANFSDSMTVMWYERRRRAHTFTSAHRGQYEFGPGGLTSRDPFGLFPKETRDVLEPAKLVVLPRIVPISGASALDASLFGARQKEGWIFTDPLHKAGTRPYQSSDSARKINWKASARHVQLQVDVEKPAFDQEIQMVLLQPERTRWWETDAGNKVELAVMAAAALVNRYSRIGQKFKLHTNLASSLSKAPQDIMAQLALLQNFSLGKSEALLRRLGQRLHTSTSIVVITTAAAISDSWAAELMRLGRKHRVVLIQVGADPSGAKLPGVRQFQVDGEVKWDEITQFELR